MLIHATCVEVDGLAVLLLGASGSGKSDLALRLIDGGACLVADDQVLLSMQGDTLMADAPSTIAGLIEVRGVGIVRLPFTAPSPVGLVVKLMEKENIERLPEPSFASFFDQAIPEICIDPTTPSAAAKVRLVVQRAIHGIMVS